MKLLKADGSGKMMTALLILVCAFFVMIIVSGSMALWIGGYFAPGSRASYLAQSAVQALVGFIGTALISAYFISKTPLSFLGLTQRVGLLPFFGVIIVYILALPCLNQLIYYNTLLRFPESLHSLEVYLRDLEDLNGKITEVILGTQSVGGLISGILIVGLLTGLAEELLFRGTLQRSLGIDRKFGQWAIWITAVIFSAVHMQFYGFFPRLLLGAFFGYLLYSTGSLWPGVFAHALNNSIVVTTAWIEKKYSFGIAADTIGVVEEGFPTWAILSLILTTAFFFTCYNRFFKSRP